MRRVLRVAFRGALPPQPLLLLLANTRRLNSGGTPPPPLKPPELDPPNKKSTTPSQAQATVDHKKQSDSPESSTIDNSSKSPLPEKEPTPPAEKEPTPPPEKEPTAPALPRGFEAFYDPRFPRHSATTPDIAYAGISPAESLANSMQDAEDARRRNKVRGMMLLTACAVGVLLFVDLEKLWERLTAPFHVIYQTSTSAIEHYERILSMPRNATGAGDEDEDDGGERLKFGDSLRRVKERTVAVFINLSNHTALHYDIAGRLVATSTYVDVDRFKQKIASWKYKFVSPEDSSTSVQRPVEIFYIVPTYFPFAAICFLWLLPLLALTHRGLNTSVSSANTMKRPGKPSRFKLEHNVKTKLHDVAGLTEVKFEVTEIVDFLKNPVNYAALGARVPRGVLIDGPPGVGKTLLAKAIAGEAMLPFISCSGSEFDEVYVGVGAKRVRELFATAKQNKPCVVFIDEIDTFGRKRRNDRSGSSRATINALLNELDGFHDVTGIMVLAATNRADTLDEALTRSGRFDRKITVDLPPHKDRVAIAKVHLAPLHLHPSITVDAIAETLASMTPGCSGADIYNICNEAAITASRLHKDAVDLECFYKAMDRIMIGMEKKAKKLTPSERERLAFHEAGHVVLTWFQETTDPILKATITPRGGKTAGVTKRLPVDRYISTQQHLRENMIAQLGGYVSEDFFFEDVSSSAADDLRRATEMAHQEVTTYGMAPAAVGHFSWIRDDYALHRPYSEVKANAIDATVHTISEEVLRQARQLLQTHLNQVRVVAGLLIKNETVTARELWMVLGERPHMTKEFRQHLETVVN